VGGGLLNTKCVFWFSLQILPEIFLILRRTERVKIKNINWSARKKVSVVCFFLGNFPASEFYMPTFRNTLSVPSSKPGRCRMTKLRNIGVFIWDVPVYPNISQPKSFYTYPPMKMEQTWRSKTSAYKIHTPGNYLAENNEHSEHGESLKSRKCPVVLSDFNQSWIFSTDFRKIFSNTNFCQNPSSLKRAVPCRRTDGRTDMTKLITHLKRIQWHRPERVQSLLVQA
jgi:hypothetical protein